MTSLLGTTALRCGLVTVSVSASSNELFLDLRRWSSSIFSSPKPLEGVPHLPQLARRDLLIGELVEERTDMSFLPWDDGEASLAETLVDQAVLPERPEPAIPQEVQCFLAEVLPQNGLHVCNVLRKGGEVGKEPFRPFPAHIKF